MPNVEACQYNGRPKSSLFVKEVGGGTGGLGGVSYGLPVWTAFVYEKSVGVLASLKFSMAFCNTLRSPTCWAKQIPTSFVLHLVFKESA